MMDGLKELLISYRNATLELLNYLESENYDGLKELLDKRQAIIDGLIYMEFSREEFRIICEDIQLLSLEKQLESVFNEKFNATRDNLKRSMSGKNINNSYLQNSYVDSIFLNKKI